MQIARLASRAASSLARLALTDPGADMRLSREDHFGTLSNWGGSLRAPLLQEWQNKPLRDSQAPQGNKNGDHSQIS